MDLVSVRDLSVQAVIGAHDWEREITQTLVFTVEMVPSAADARMSARSDDLADALDYSAVAQTIVSVVQDGRFRLIETAAERVAERLLTDHPVAWLRLEVRKPIAGRGYPAAVSGSTAAVSGYTAAVSGYTAAVTIERGVPAGGDSA